jgi:drug/metabolite transporter superfamily protein YnfA
MGPVEWELRGGYATWFWVSESSRPVWLLCCDCARSLGFSFLAEAYRERALPDVLSEAIEAAGALRL